MLIALILITLVVWSCLSDIASIQNNVENLRQLKIRQKELEETKKELEEFLEEYEEMIKEFEKDYKDFKEV